MGLIDPPGRIVGGRIVLEGARASTLQPEADAHAARQSHRDDLPGPDDDAQSGAAHRHADDRGRFAHIATSRAGRRASARAMRWSGSASRRRTSDCALSAPVLGRHAPARRHRDRVAERARPHHRRRADHRARRDHPGTDPVRDAEARARDRRCADLDHARPVGGRRTRRPHLRHVCGSHRRAGHGGGRAGCAASSVHARTARFGSGERRGAHATPADSRNDAVAARPAGRLRLSRALRLRAVGVRARSADVRRRRCLASRCAAFIRCGCGRRGIAAGAARSSALPLLELRGMQQALRAAARFRCAPGASGGRRGACAVVRAVDRGRSRDRGARSRRAGRRVGLRQVDARTTRGRFARADRRGASAGAVRPW